MTEQTTPIHSLEAEQAVIGGLLVDIEAWDKVVDIINEFDFYRHEHQIVFRCMKELMELNICLDIDSICGRLGPDLGFVGGKGYIAELVRTTPSAENIAAYAKIVKERSILRQIAQVGKEISQVSVKATSDALEKVASKFIKQNEVRRAKQILPSLLFERMEFEPDPLLEDSVRTVSVCLITITGKKIYVDRIYSISSNGAWIKAKAICLNESDFSREMRISADTQDTVDINIGHIVAVYETWNPYLT